MLVVGAFVQSCCDIICGVGRRLRLLIYGINYAPELTGIGKYTGEMCAWLAARGHEVRVVTAPPYYPAWRVRDDYAGRGFLREGGEGEAVVFRCPLWVPERPTGVTRLLHLISFAVSSFPRLLQQVFWRPDVVFTVEPAFFCAPMALLAAAWRDTPTWLHVQDFEIDAAFELGILPQGGVVQVVATEFEDFCMKNFDRVSSISPKMVERSAEKGVPEGKRVLFPNWVDVEAVYPMAAGANRYREELGIGDGVVVALYSGNMGAKQGLEVLPELARRFAGDERVRFVFCGDGAFRPQLEDMVAAMENVSLLPLQPMEHLNELLNAADVHLLPQRADAADLVMPSKLTGMLASGRPVVATAAAGTQVAQVVEGCGYAVRADDIEALHAAIERLVCDVELRAEMGARARQYAVEHLGTEQVLRHFEEQLEELVASGGSGRGARV